MPITWIGKHGNTVTAESMMVNLNETNMKTNMLQQTAAVQCSPKKCNRELYRHWPWSSLKSLCSVSFLNI